MQLLHIELIYSPFIWSLHTWILSCASCCSFEIFKYFIDLYLFISLYDFLAYSSIVSIVSCKTFSWLLLFIIIIGLLYFSCLQLYFKPHEFTICFCNVLVFVNSLSIIFYSWFSKVLSKSKNTLKGCANVLPIFLNEVYLLYFHSNLLYFFW